MDLSSDLKNAFNSYCRSKMWDVLRDNFPSLYSLVLLMYGDEASVLFEQPRRDERVGLRRARTPDVSHERAREAAARAAAASAAALWAGRARWR